MPEIDDTWMPAPAWFEWGVMIAGVGALAAEIAGAVTVAGWVV